jgi:hypothetical protein
VSAAASPTDEQLRAHPGFRRIVLGRRIEQTAGAVGLAVFVVVLILAFRRPDDNPFVVWIPAVLVVTAAQLYARRLETRAIAEITTGPQVQRRIRLLVWPWAETRYLCLIP